MLLLIKRSNLPSFLFYEFAVFFALMQKFAPNCTDHIKSTAYRHCGINKAWHDTSAAAFAKFPLDGSKRANKVHFWHCQTLTFAELLEQAVQLAFIAFIYLQQ